MLKSAFGGLSTGVCRQPQWAYVGVFMYSLAGWSCEDEIGLGDLGGTVSQAELYLIIHAEMPLRLFMDFSAGSFCISNRNIPASQEKLYPILHARHYPHIIPNYPRAYIQRRTEHFRGCLQTPVLNPPKADFSIRCACNQTKVCRRECSGRRNFRS